MRKQIEAAAKMYKCQASAKTLFGAEYPQRIQVYKNIIVAHQAKFSLDVLPSVTELCSFESIRDNGVALMMFMAAAVELIEPGK